MKLFALLALSCSLQLFSKAGSRDSIINFPLADSIRAVSFLADLRFPGAVGKKNIQAGLRADDVRLVVEKNKKKCQVIFYFPGGADLSAIGLDVKASGKGKLSWPIDVRDNETCTLFITSAADSVGNFMLYSGYIRLPKQKAWKLIGTCRLNGSSHTLASLSGFYTGTRDTVAGIDFVSAWCQRINGSWKNMASPNAPAPALPPMSNMDSLRQARLDSQQMQSTLAAGNSTKMQIKEGIYYTILKEGTGRSVAVTDTVIARYKGTIFTDGTLFDQTTDKPARFPLNRLIRGWQIGVPLCRVGGKIQLLIPSGLAYGIRTRAPKIPPNSILLFEVEVIDVTPKN